MEIIKTGNLEKIVDVLKNGGLVILPTETVYIAVIDATNGKAVKKLVNYKNRPFGKPFSVGTTNLEMMKNYVEMNEAAENLYKTFHPGPITIVCHGKHKVAPGIESELGTLGIFVTDHKLTIDVIKKLGKPITTTSANASYQPRPFKISNLFKYLSKKQKGLIDLVVDAGEIPFREASTVIDITLDDPAILRQGEIKLKDKVEVLSRSEEATQNIGKELWQKYEKYTGQRAIVFALEGPMGAGKTQFTKGLARAMGIKEEVVSPTYDLEIRYPKGLTHIDAWRMQNPEELEDLNFSELMQNKKGVLAIEWAEKVSEVIRNYDEEAVIVWVKIRYLPRRLRLAEDRLRRAKGRSKAKADGKGPARNASSIADAGGENKRLISWGVL